jgi:hypothetical protein
MARQPRGLNRSDWQCRDKRRHTQRGEHDNTYTHAYAYAYAYTYTYGQDCGGGWPAARFVAFRRVSSRFVAFHRVSPRFAAAFLVACASTAPAMRSAAITCSVRGRDRALLV